jgi:hypothetical protein
MMCRTCARAWGGNVSLSASPQGFEKFGVQGSSHFWLSVNTNFAARRNMAVIISTSLNGNTSIDHESLQMTQSTQASLISVFEMFKNGLFAIFVAPTNMSVCGGSQR